MVLAQSDGIILYLQHQRTGLIYKAVGSVFIHLGQATIKLPYTVIGGLNDDFLLSVEGVVLFAVRSMIELKPWVMVSFYWKRTASKV